MRFLKHLSVSSSSAVNRGPHETPKCVYMLLHVTVMKFRRCSNLFLERLTSVNISDADSEIY